MQFQTAYRSLSENTSFPIVWYITSTDRETSVSDHCEQEPDHRDVSSSLSHSNVMNGKEVDVKEEDNDVLSSFISSQLHNTCEQMYRNSTSHETHTADKPHECDVCHKTFSDFSQLTMHKRIHNGVRLFVCDVCSMAFSSSSSLIKHKDVHSAIKPFTCDVCKKTFSLSVYLTQHKRIHSGERPHACNICNKTFVRIRPYVCNVCLRTFTNGSGLNAHKHVHSDIK